jgi:hypothetical protein
VTTSPTSYTVTLTDGVTASLTDTRTVKVYSGVGITNKPSTEPTVQPGASSTAFTVSGGDSSQYTWTVTDRAQTVIGTPASGSSFTFTAPNTGAFAGEYTITVKDKNNLSNDTFKVKVPITLTPSSKTFLQNAPQSFTVAGAASTYTWDVLNESTLAVVTSPAAEYGTWTKTSPVSGDATNTFTPAAVTAAKGFYIQITIDGDADLTTANGLNKAAFGPFRIIPLAQYAVNVKTVAGAAIPGAQVTVDYAGQVPQTTDAQGKAVFNLPSAGKYLYNVSMANYVSQNISSTLNPLTVTLQATGSTISGTVTPLPGAGGATVTAYLPTAPTTRYATSTDAGNGTYGLDCRRLHCHNPDAQDFDNTQHDIGVADLCLRCKG